MEILGPNLFQAVSAQALLRIELPVPEESWIEIRYRSGLLGDPVRPLLRMTEADGRERVEIMPGPVCGSARWVGRIPPGVTALHIEPVARSGRFAFAVDGIAVLSRSALVLGALRRKPILALEAVWLRLRGRRLRARHFMKSIWASHPFHRYASWLAEREAPPPLIEAPPAEPEIAILVDATRARAGEAERTLGSLETQSSPPRYAVVAKGAEDVARAVRTAAWIGVVDAGDTLAPTALVAMAAAASRDPAATILYSDEDRIDRKGRRSDPSLKPDWSPRFHGSRAYLGGLTLVRATALAALTDATSGRSLAQDLLETALATPGAKVGHVRRILYHRAARPGPAPRPIAPARASPARRAPVSIVVPNRDRLGLLKPCIDGLRLRTAYPALDIVLVDNGSVEPATHAFYASLADDPRVSILDRPGPFNFSALCNAGVAASRGEVIVLLNNDVEVIGPDWLDVMVAQAVRPEVGAVGAKLLYPDGRLQHGGVVVGLGGAAGHIHRGRSGDDPGWMSRLLAPHEVSAVTGACLAVTRSKYDAVGGLDEDLFPVSFNDIDLCLKLRERGWINVMAPHAVLIHHESASRGRDISGPNQARAEREAAHFAEKWLHVMRDDPYFHPGLSLLRYDVSLG